jgi:hypothetical protein
MNNDFPSCSYGSQLHIFLGGSFEELKTAGKKEQAFY